ncbi:MAG: GntR family transcriptional regulator [Verrucomicrobia bacterium]|nr:GntR family transcriptional regulator [Verrucomicrobiota bacterium]
MDLEFQVQSADPAHVQIERFLRRQIETERIRPGERLLSNMELAQKWKISCTAVQMALARLTTDGLVERSRGRGTFVKSATHPLTIGVLVGANLSDETAYFFRSVVGALHSQTKDRAWTFRVYDNLSSTQTTDPHLRGGWQHLAHDLRNYPFGGLIEFGARADSLADVCFDKELPKATMCADVAISDLVPDERHFGFESANFIVSQGRRNLVYLHSPVAHDDALDGIRDAVRQAGLRPPRIEELRAMGGYALEKEAFEKMSRLVQSGPPSGPGTNAHHAPDALVVCDDIAMRGVALALVQHRVSVPAQLLVVTHANEGIHLHYGVPVVRYNFSPKQIAEELLRLLRMRMLKQAVGDLPLKFRGQLQAEEEFRGSLSFPTRVATAAKSSRP